ncbi:WD40 repeat-like protein [Fomitiporia mediterranea MF3/22]|uniref:WD40 repeat-like protein n=1 Tax=Fomitiporia mediterranea (strain MF3/22) TaxID=694068 RepID=UPI00044094A2|nr:WD40 repeat-like protein [Fomitiporia mediterranea MF3/22]EJD05418.1 WD40 repeat-like protein [Fomitiporia mediterranea MF3/22]
MIQTSLIQNAHSDLVTDACYDFYGLYLATCGLDQRIKLWALDESSGQWNLEDEWKAHDATVTKVSWAHPIYGPVIASCSFDGTVKVWEQVHVDSVSDASGTGASSGNTKWEQRAVLFEAKGSVRAIEFSPHHFGLKLAAVSSDNQLRTYECVEQPALSSWQLVDEVDVPSLSVGSAHGGPSLAQTLAPGTPTPSASGAIALDSASVSNLLQTAQQQQSAAHGAGRPGVGLREADGGWCLSWCKDKYWGEVLAVGCGVSGVVKIIQFSSHRPHALLALEPPPPSTSAPAVPRGNTSRSGGYAAAVGGSNVSSNDTPYAVTSVAWAPSCGRSFHLIATGSRDGRVRIWKVRPPPPSVTASMHSNGMVMEEDMAVDSLDEKWSASLVAEFDDHKSSVGRVEWNITGTVLSSSGNDGRVRLWKQTVGGVWRPAGHISVEQAEERPQATDVDMDENGGTS